PRKLKNQDLCTGGLPGQYSWGYLRFGVFTARGKTLRNRTTLESLTLLVIGSANYQSRCFMTPAGMRVNLSYFVNHIQTHKSV
ncbi:MAG: hypothetical protein ABFR33_02880, partial [Verrucomicrobiota bacterium]